VNIDWIGKLQHLLQTLAFCLGIAAIQYAFMPERAYAPLAAYSLAIGTSIWFIIDMGRHLAPSSRETGWPQGFAGLALPIAGIVLGFFLGTKIGDWLSQAFGFYSDRPPVDLNADVRNSVLVTAIAGVVGSYYFYSMNRSNYLQRKMAEARRHANEARLKLLETQLEPHMLFNTLANLRALIAADPARAQEMLDHMIAYLRSTLSASRSAMHPLQAECERLRDYLELMAIRMGPRLRYEIDVPDALAQVRVPALLLQPLVENSIHHGLEPSVGGGTVIVSARSDGDALVLQVKDSPAVVPAQAGTRSVASGIHDPGPGGHDVERSGFGLAQVRERVATLYEDKGSFRIHIGREGSLAEIRLPLAA
jgi:hypothetical protein